VDGAGNVYIADTNNDRIRKVTVATGIITTVAGTGVGGFAGDGGQATAARLQNPTGVAATASGDLYIADRYNHRIRKVSASTGVITTVAGSGTAGYGGDNGAATAAQLYYPYAVAVDAAGNLFIADTNNNRIRKVTAATGIITTIAGNGNTGYNGDGPAIGASLYSPDGVAVDASGNVYISDQYNYRVRKVNPATGIISTVAGTGTAGFSGEAGPAISAKIYLPVGLAVDASGNLYFADYYNDRIRKVTVATGIITTVAGSASSGTFGGDGGDATAAQIARPTAVALDSSGSLYIADMSNQRVRKVGVPVATRVLSTPAGNGSTPYNGEGPAIGAALNTPDGVATDSSGNIYIADLYHDRIRKVTIATGVISTVAGTGVAGYSGENGPATSARIYNPHGMAVDSAGNFYFGDYYNSRVRKVTAATGLITTVAGSGTYGSLGDGGLATAAQLSYPTAVAVDAAGNLYIADSNNHRIRKVAVGTAVITTIAGTGAAGVGGDGGLATLAQLNDPQGVAVDAAGNVYIGDTNNHRIRKITAATGIISTYAGTGSQGYEGEAGPATSALFRYPTGLAVDGAGNLYIADYYNHRIRRISAATEIITTVVGSGDSDFGGDGGAASAGQLSYPYAVGVDSTGNVYVADTNNNRIRKAVIPLFVPGTLTVSRYGAGGVSLSWGAAPGATSYNVKRGTFSGGETVIATVVGGTTYLDTTAAFGTTYYYVVSAVYGFTESGNSNEASIRLTRSAPGSDYDSDGKADLALYRPSTGYWYILYSGANYGNYGAYKWGLSTDVAVPGDYDGDGKGDLGLYRPSTGYWYVLLSGSNYSSYLAVPWGIAGDVPVPGDYDGDGKTDLGLYRPATGYWYVLLSSTNYTSYIAQPWGIAGDVPVTGDYDGDGRTDLGLYRPSTGYWYVLLSSTGFTNYLVESWGIAGDIPVPDDYDGDGKADMALYRPSTGYWYVLLSSSNFTSYLAVSWGIAGDTPVTGDYDGDGKADLALYRPATGYWYVLLSSTGYSSYIAQPWGIAGDTPVLGRR
jgi:sugar lactone lactonase YvrE